jgi:hypothetical protein
LISGPFGLFYRQLVFHFLLFAVCLRFFNFNIMRWFVFLLILF